MSLHSGILSVMLAPMLFCAVGCHTYPLEITVENHTGGPIQLLEVDYPSASFGADSLASGAILPYRIQVRGSGPIKVEYNASGGLQARTTGPTLAERQQGRVQIILLPQGKVEFHPEVTQQP
jgi:hypothetical protein